MYLNKDLIDKFYSDGLLKPGPTIFKRTQTFYVRDSMYKNRWYLVQRGNMSPDVENFVP